MIPLARMRWIDRWLGVPLLWLLGGWLRIKRLMRGCLPGAASFSDVDIGHADHIETNVAPVRVLTLLLSEMGSLVLAEPALRQLQQGRAIRLGLCVFERNRECLALLSTLQHVDLFVIRDQNLPQLLWDVWRFRRWCRQRRFDVVIDMELFSRFSGWLSVLTGAPVRSGFDNCANEGLYRGRLLTHPVWYNPYQHMAHNYLTLVDAVVQCLGQGLNQGLSQGLGESQDEGLTEGFVDQHADSGLPYVKAPLGSELPKPTPFQFDPHQQVLFDRQLACAGVELFSQVGAGCVLINVAASDLIAQRNWPLASQVELCQLLLATYPQRQVVLCGDDAQRGLARRIMQQLDHPRCLSVAGLFRLAQLPYLYRRAAMMVTPDSGPAHFAAVTSMPVLVLFGPETPVLYRPLGNSRVLSAGLRCSPCVSAANHRHTLCRDNQCMALISAQQVHRLVREMLAADRADTADLIRLIPKTG
jgi:ADP-heptose:LPS heptosyltransferase